MKHKFLLLYSWLVRSSLFFFPDIPLIMRFRGFLYGLGMLKCGRDFQVSHDVILKGLANLKIGNNVFIGNHSIIMGSGSVTIEDEVMLGPNVIVVSGNHTLKSGSYRYGCSDYGEIFIGRGAWIAANCTISMNSTLPHGSLLGANSFLNKNLEVPNAIYGGIPAKFIKNA